MYVDLLWCIIIIMQCNHIEGNKLSMEMFNACKLCWKLLHFVYEKTCFTFYLDLDLDAHWIRIHNSVKGWIRIRIRIRIHT
jgi:hypothetical protein